MSDQPLTLQEIEQSVVYAAGAYIQAYTAWFNSEPWTQKHHRILRDNAHDGLERAVIKWLKARKEPK